MAHAASQWQIAVSGTSFSSSTGFASTTFDSGTDATNLVSLLDAGPLLSGVTYEATVRHQSDDAGLWSDWASPAEFTTETEPAPVLRPNGFTATTASVIVDELDASWTSNIYEHALTADFAAPTTVERTGADQDTYTATGLTTGVVVYFRTRGRLTASTFTPWSNTVAITPLDSFEDSFSPPTIFTSPRFHYTSATGDEIEFCWDAPSDATSFAVAPAFDVSPSWTEIANAAALVGLVCYTPDLSNATNFPDGPYVASVVVDGTRYISNAFIIDRTLASLDLAEMLNSLDGWSPLGNVLAPWQAVMSGDAVCSTDPAYPRPVTTKFRQHGPNIEGANLRKVDIPTSDGWLVATTASVYSAGIGIGGGVMYEAEFARVQVGAGNEQLQVYAYMGDALLDFNCGKTIGTSGSGEFGVVFNIPPGVFGVSGWSFSSKVTDLPFAASFNTPLGRCGCNLPYGSRHWTFKLALRYSFPDLINFPQRVRLQGLLGTPYNVVIDETFDVPEGFPLTSVQCVSPMVGSAHVPNFITQDFGWRQYDSFYALAFGESTCGAVPPDEIIPPVEFGIPCDVVLDKYAEDRTTVEWSVSLSGTIGEGHLLEPSRYAPQEANIPEGSVSIGTAEYEIVDPPTDPTDQDTGLMTSRIADAFRRGAIAGNRMRMRRFTRIGADVPWQTIVDGDAGEPRLTSYASYAGSIRDTRERERRLTAFTRSRTTSMLPRGPAIPWGLSNPRWLSGTVGYSPTVQTAGDGVLEVSLASYWTGTNEDPPLADSLDVLVSTSTREAMTPRIASIEEASATVNIVDLVWDNVEIWWLPAGDATPTTRSEDWNKIRKPHLIGYFDTTIGLPHVETIGGIVYEGVTFDLGGSAVYDNLWGVRRVLLGDPSIEGDELLNTYPAVDQTIDFMVVYSGPATENLPFHFGSDPAASGTWFATTSGKALRAAYDGKFSAPDPITGEDRSTGIRYDADVLAAMTHELLIRVEEPAESLLEWLEENVYKAIGYIPSVDYDGRISPRPETRPSDDVLVLDANVIIPDQSDPGWRAGDLTVNILRYKYRRYGVATVPLQSDTSTQFTATTFTNRLNQEKFEALRQRVFDTVARRLAEGDVIPREPVDRVVVRDETFEYRLDLPSDTSSIVRFGPQEVEVDTYAAGIVGTQRGNPLDGFPVETEPGFIYAQRRNAALFPRYGYRCPTMTVKVLREPVLDAAGTEVHPGTESLVTGDWVILDCSWIPNYDTRTRGAYHYAQIVAIADLDCITRDVTLEITEAVDDTETLVGKDMPMEWHVGNAAGVEMPMEWNLDEDGS